MAMREIQYVFEFLKRAKVGQSLHLASDCIALLKSKPRIRKLSIDKEIRFWFSQKEKLLEVSVNGHVTFIDDFGLNKKGLNELKALSKYSPEVRLAEIDQDGFLLSYFGAIEGVPTVSKENFIKRKRYTLEAVLLSNKVGLKKRYNGNKLAFLNELNALHDLATAGCNLPSIMDVDFCNLSITFSYILGPVLREVLAKKGAIVRDRDVNNDPRFTFLSPDKRWIKRIEEGRRYLNDVVGQGFIEDLYGQLLRIHASGYLWNDVKYGNIIIEKKSGKPYLIDFERALNCSNFSKTFFEVMCDQEKRNLKLHFGIDNWAVV